MNGRTLAPLAALLLLLGQGPSARAQDDAPPAPATANVDVRPRPLGFITPGTVIGDGAPQGWSNLVLIAKPRLGAGDIDSVPKTAAKYSSMFLFAILANVRDDGAGFALEKVAIGSALEINGQRVIATSAQTFGKDLGFIGRRVFQENENMLASDVKQVARTRTMIVFDANAIMLYNQKHSRMVIRHVILVSPKDGTLSTLVWLLGADGKGGYALAERTLQMLPPGMQEDRALSVDAQKFTLGIPSQDAFALIRLPQGSAVRFAKALVGVAAVRRFVPETAVQLEEVLQTSYAPLAAQVAAKKVTRR